MFYNYSEIILVFMRWLKLSSVAITIFFACVSETTTLRGQLNSPDPVVRANAAKRLGELRDKEAVPHLVKLLKDTVPMVRFEAILALGKVGDREAIQPIFEVAKGDKREDVAMAATKALADIGNSATDPLIKLLTSHRAVVRMTAARGLGRLRISPAVEPLIRLLGDRDPNVRRAAISALRRIGDPKGMEAIARMVTSPDRTTEESAEEALSGRGYEEQLEEVRRLLRSFRR